METQICPNTSKCPIFSGVLKGTQLTETYKSTYCEAGETGRNKCMRFLVKQKTGKCPENVLPNSSKTFDEIIEEMKKRGDI
jgi:hypothetical protein